jgi:hypothetical protein
VASAQCGQTHAISPDSSALSTQPAGSSPAWPPCSIVVAPHPHVWREQTYAGNVS